MPGAGGNGFGQTSCQTRVFGSLQGSREPREARHGVSGAGIGCTSGCIEMAPFLFTRSRANLEGDLPVTLISPGCGARGGERGDTR